MDRLAYIAMTGAQQILQQQAVAANNLAQAGTPGFKADSLAFRVVPVVGAAPGTRAYAVATTPGADMRPGPVEQTGRVLDVALDGNAMLAVQSRDGLEAYTRAGRLAISSDGELRTHGGLTVLGEGGPIAVPEGARLAIARDGTVSAVVESQGSANVQVLGRLKLVTPGEGGVVKGADSLFRTPGWPARCRRRGAPHVGRPRGQQREHGGRDGRHDRLRAPVRDADEAPAVRRSERSARFAAPQSGRLTPTKETP